MKTFLTQLFTWWNGTTLNGRFHLWRYGERVGEDEFGNVYYRLPNTAYPNEERRWVQYAGVAEASAIPTGWWGWMHHTTDTPPTREHVEPRPWQKPHRANPTGTASAYRPPGSTLGAGTRPTVTGDYDAWRPG